MKSIYKFAIIVVNYHQLCSFSKEENESKHEVEDKN